MKLQIFCWFVEYLQISLGELNYKNWTKGAKFEIFCWLAEYLQISLGELNLKIGSKEQTSVLLANSTDRGGTASKFFDLRTLRKDLFCWTIFSELSVALDVHL